MITAYTNHESTKASKFLDHGIMQGLFAQPAVICDGVGHVLGDEVMGCFDTRVGGKY